LTTRLSRSWNGESLMDGFLRCFEKGVKKQEPTGTWLLLPHAGYCRKQPWDTLQEIVGRFPCAVVIAGS
jgi:hypothetical protein